MRRLGLFVIVAACHNRTELMVGVATDIKAPDILDEVDLDVSRTSDGFPEETLQWNITGVEDQPFNLPGSYGVFSSDGSEVQLQLDLTGRKHGQMVVTRRAIMSLIADQTLFYRIGITAGCQTMQDCGSPDMTCIEGVCKDVHLDAHQFPQFADELVDNLSCNSGIAYIDTGTNTPMTFTADAAQCPTGQCSEGTCLVPPMSQGGCPPPSTLVNGFCACPDGTIPNGNADPCPTGRMCTSDVMCSQGFHCNTSTGMCELGVPMKDGGGTSCLVPRGYGIQWNCSGALCPNNYPGAVGNIVLDAQGNGDYVADPGVGVNGTCSSSLNLGNCTATINCNITTGATGTATGTIQFSGTTGSGSIQYTWTSPSNCDETCTVTLQ